jgi:hypothetical protein
MCIYVCKLPSSSIEGDLTTNESDASASPLPHSINTPHLRIRIAKRPTQRITRPPNRRPRHTHKPQLNRILERRIPTRRVVIHRNRARKRKPPLLDIQILPRPPRAINHAVMQEKRRVRRARKQITSRVPSNRKVPARVHAQEPRGEVALHGVCEGEEVGAVSDQGRDFAVARASGGGAVHVAPEAARVVAQAGPGFWVWQHGEQHGGDRAEIDGPVFEGAALDAAAAGAGREGYAACVWGGDAGVGTVGDVDAVSAHGCGAAVKGWRFFRVVGPSAEVGLVRAAVFWMVRETYSGQL